jgi:hypothetical protein
MSRGVFGRLGRVAAGARFAWCTRGLMRTAAPTRWPPSYGACVEVMGGRGVRSTLRWNTSLRP